MDYENDIDGHGMQESAAGASPGDSTDTAPEVPEQNKKLAQQLCRTIKEDKAHHEKAFKRMRRDMQVAMWGADKTWGEERYRANISGRHVKQKTAALYAKNPRIVARRRETLDFKVWDENPSSLLLAYQTIQAGMAAAQQASAQTDMMAQAPMDPGMQPGPVVPQMPPGFDQAQAVIADFSQGMARRQQVDKIGKTLEILFNYYAKEQKPLDLKRGMKTTVRRATTTGVGYVELAFQRQYGPSPMTTERLADARVRLDHLKMLAEEMGEGEYDDTSAERAELEMSVQSLAQEPQVVLREGLVFDFPQSTKVIPDKRCKSLDGFIGAGRVTVEYAYTCDEVKEQFGVDLKNGDYSAYTANAGSTRDFCANNVMDDDYEWSPPSEKKKNGLVCVWKMYDKPSGLVYYLADGYEGFLREPAAPDVFVEDFWPLYALTFNAVESEDELFPPSDVSLMFDMQKEHNRSRQGKREHRDAARPRWVYSNGAFDEEDGLNIRDMKPFEALGINIDPTTDIKNVLQVLPVPGVDPNLYDTGEVFTDTQLVVGSQEATFGGVSKATATESAIAANSTTSSDASSIDDLDAFLTSIAKAAGQILLRECSAEKVQEIAGVGAVWPEMTLEEISSELYLEIEAGSTGKPNQAVEIANWQRLLPLMLQIPNIDPTWLAKQTIRRLDDRLDLTEAVAAGMPSVAAMNMQRGQPGAAAQADPGRDPGAQGAAGANNSPRPQQAGGSAAAFGSNQTDPTPGNAPPGM